VVVATERELVNLPPAIERHLPTGISWVEDLNTLTKSVVPEPLVEMVEIISDPEPTTPPKKLSLDEIAKLPRPERVVQTRRVDRGRG
jgi:hypothetical protein